ncbi:TIGR04255 family protein [Pasteurella multocida]|uniref:TIGR04255 family protein n=1 Tax=Pasteurella multocida TaxID=747 RepID=UPI002CA5A9FE|nr:TIGR04255 family protein [Pasteurella multocida]MEB3499858.1 TIGR04255 family protein [Pasteurella multocida]
MNSVKYYKLNKQPLLFVLAEFRFPIIMKMEGLIPELQDRFRAKLPYFEEQLSQEVKLQSQGIEVSSSKQWNFIDKERKHAIVINPSRIICISSHYDRFEGFSSFCLDSIRILKEVAAPAFVERVGLRYGDLITPIEGSPISDLVQSNLCNISYLSDVGELSHKLSEISLKTSEGNMMIRSLYGEHNLSVLPDVVNLPIKINLAETSSERIILDSDHVWESGDEKELTFEEEAILSKLKDMHLLSREAFWSCTTEKGRELWK